MSRKIIFIYIARSHTVSKDQSHERVEIFVGETCRIAIDLSQLLVMVHKLYFEVVVKVNYSIVASYRSKINIPATERSQFLPAGAKEGVKVIGRCTIIKKTQISTIRSMAERVRDHNHPVYYCIFCTNYTTVLR